MASAARQRAACYRRRQQGYLLPLAGCGLTARQPVPPILAAPPIPAAVPADVRCRATMTITAAWPHPRPADPALTRLEISRLAAAIRPRSWLSPGQTLALALPGGGGLNGWPVRRPARYAAQRGQPASGRQIWMAPSRTRAR